MNAPAKLNAVLSDDIVRQVLETAGGRRPVDVMSEMLGLAGPALVAAAAPYFGLKAMELAEMRSCKADFEAISFLEASQRLCLALTGPEQRGLVVLSDPLDSRTRAWAAERMRRRRRNVVIWALASTEDMRAYLTQAERSMRAMDSVGVSGSAATAAGSGAVSVSLADISASSSPIVRLVDSTIHDALKALASDIHLETQHKGLVIKYRVDGVLEVIKRVEGLDAAHHVLSRIKVLAELDIAERRIPQDGRFKVSVRRARDRLARLHHAQPLRRGRGAADPRPQQPGRRGAPDPPRGAGLRAVGARFRAAPVGAAYGMLLVTGPTG